MDVNLYFLIRRLKNFFAWFSSLFTRDQNFRVFPNQWTFREWKYFALGRIVFMELFAYHKCAVKIFKLTHNYFHRNGVINKDVTLLINRWFILQEFPFGPFSLLFLLFIFTVFSHHLGSRFSFRTNSDYLHHLSNATASIKVTWIDRS